MFFAQFLLQSKLSTSEGSSMTRVRPSNCHPTDKHPKALRTWLLCMPLAFCYLPLRQPGSKLNSAHYSYCKQVFSQASRISCCRVVGKYWWRTWLLCIDAEPDYSACHSPLATCHRGNQAGALNYSPHWLNRRPRRGLLTTRLSGGDRKLRTTAANGTVMVINASSKIRDRLIFFWSKPWPFLNLRPVFSAFCCWYYQM